MDDLIFIPLQYLKPVGIKMIRKKNRRHTRLAQDFLEAITNKIKK